MIPFAKHFVNQEKKKEIMADIEHLLFDDDGHKISNSEYCRKLEEEVAKISGADYAILTSCCTMAMTIGLGACGAKGMCWTQSFTWPSTAVAAQMQGSPSTFRDIDRELWIAPDYKVSANPREQERAYAIAVDTFGMQYAPVSYLPIFFDRAHSLGVRFRSLGVASFLSFSASKLVTGVEGGVALTNKEKFVEPMRNARDLMCREGEDHAMYALYGLKKLPELLEWKKGCYDVYKKAFPECEFQKGEGNHQVIGALFPSKEIRDRVVKEISSKVEIKIYYEPLHLRNPKSPSLKVTEDIYDRILALPSWYKCPVDEVIEAIRGALDGY